MSYSMAQVAAVVRGIVFASAFSLMLTTQTQAIASESESCLPLNVMSAGEIRSEIIGSKLSGYSVRTKARWTERMHPDGVAEFRNASGKPTFGRWRLRGRSLCFSYGTRTEWTCKTVHRASNRCELFRYALIDEVGDFTSAIFAATPLGGGSISAAKESDLGRAIEREKSWSSDTRKGVQNALIWSGDYNGRLDAEFGGGTRNAIRSFQKRTGFPVTGYLTSSEIKALERQRKRAIERVGFEVRTDYETGIRIGIPALLFESRIIKDYLVDYQSRNGRGSESLTLISTVGGSALASELYRDFLTLDAFGDDAYRVIKDDFFVISGERRGTGTYIAAWFGDGTVKGFILSWPSSRRAEYRPIATAMFNSFEAIPNVVLQPTRSAETSNASDPPTTEERESPDGGSGTGFVVATSGKILTNAHVIDGCSAPVLDGKIPASVVAQNEEVDLALLQAVGGQWDSVAKFSPLPARLNSDVTVIGYPLHGILGGLNVTRGSVSSLSGLAGRLGEFQITAAVQPGNSGGPVVGPSGGIIGVVRSKLNALKVAKAVGDIPQNINFAIRAETAKLFLLGQGIQVQLNERKDHLPPADLADLADAFTVLIECQ